MTFAAGALFLMTASRSFLSSKYWCQCCQGGEKTGNWGKDLENKTSSSISGLKEANITWWWLSHQKRASCKPRGNRVKWKIARECDFFARSSCNSVSLFAKTQLFTLFMELAKVAAASSWYLDNFKGDDMLTCPRNKYLAFYWENEDAPTISSWKLGLRWGKKRARKLSQKRRANSSYSFGILWWLLDQFRNAKNQG